MATFERGSKVFLKGAEISFRDVVVDNRDSRIVFRSSNTDKVICELGPSTKAQSKPPSVGSPVKVTGRVKGRGGLGNVTLENCSVSAVDEAAVLPEAGVPKEVAIAPPADIVPEEPKTPAPVPEVPLAPSKDVATNPVAKRSSSPLIAPAGESPAPKVMADQRRATLSTSAEDCQCTVPYSLYALLFLAGAIAPLLLSTLLRPALRAMTLPKPSVPDNTAETRQAALHALLLKTSKKK